MFAKAVAPPYDRLSTKLLDAALLARRSPFAGVGSGVAAALKVTPAFVLVALFAARRARAALVGTATFASATLIGAVAFPSETRRYWTSVLWATSRVGNPHVAFNAQRLGTAGRGTVSTDFSNSIQRAVSWLPFTGPAQTVVWFALVATVGVVAIVRARRALDIGNPLAAITLASCATYAISPITWGHHLFFLGPMTLLTVGDGRSRWRLGAAAIVAYLVMDPFEQGEGSFISACRIALCVIAVAFMPIESSTPTNHEPSPTRLQAVQPG